MLAGLPGGEAQAALAPPRLRQSGLRDRSAPLHSRNLGGLSEESRGHLPVPLLTENVLIHRPPREPKSCAPCLVKITHRRRPRLQGSQASRPRLWEHFQVSCLVHFLLFMEKGKIDVVFLVLYFVQSINNRAGTTASLIEIRLSYFVLTTDFHGC